ncbi:MAG: Peptide chain release factor 2 [bacterium ADurb.Bin374]|nr:MAG: Peptide chain release factor 2 [bacterium ADurb.Bin374]
MRERTLVEKRLADFRVLESGLNDNRDMIALAEAEGEEGLIAEAEKALAELRDRARKAQVAALLSGEADGNDAYVEVHAGAGGTESQDWAEMLARMYVRWAEQHDYDVEWLEESPGEEAGLKSATFQVKGPNAYGWLKTESGVHRLVRISPFDSNARRHTSFTAVDVTPVLPDDADIEVRDEDIKLDFFRSSGAGGQHVNKTSSAVRITHLPTGIVVACQIERSQHQNREVALNMLKAKLYKLQQESREKELKNLQGDQKNISFGSQIRSYVFCPYTLVKDLRTGEQTSDVHGVMDGDLDRFVNGYLKWHAAGEKPRGIGADGEEEEEI